MGEVGAPPSARTFDLKFREDSDASNCATSEQLMDSLDLAGYMNQFPASHDVLYVS